MKQETRPPSLRAPICAWLFVPVLLAGLARADGFRNPPPSASALGRAGGHVAQADDASAAALNPARMTSLSEAEIMVSLTAGYGRRRFESFYGPRARSTDPWAFLPAGFGVLPFADGRAALGLSLTVPFGRFTRYPSDVFFGQITPYESALRVVQLNPSLAWRLHDRLSVAAGLSYYDSKLAFKYHPGIRFEGDGDALGYNAAIAWTPTDRQTLALVYRASFDIAYSGDFEADSLPPDALAAGAAPSSPFRTRFNYPAMLALGYGLQLTDTLRGEIGIEWIEHSRNQQFAVDIGRNNFLLHASPSDAPLILPQDWHNNWTAGIGADWLFAPGWTLRAGYLYLESPAPSRTTIPVAAERNQSILSAGLGFDRGRHTVDAAYVYGWIDRLKVRNHVSGDPDRPSPLDGDYTLDSHLIALSYACRF